MSILVRFTPAPGTTAEKYDATQPLIEEAAGEWPPDGLEYHVAFSTGGDIRVSRDLGLEGAVRGFRRGPDAGPRRERCRTRWPT